MYNEIFGTMTVKKRNGDIVAFDRVKICTAIKNAFKASDELLNIEEATNAVSNSVFSILAHPDTLHGRPETYSIEEIQDLVETHLMLHKYTKTAKAFILYRQKRAENRDATTNFDEYIDKYFADAVWDIKENSNTTQSLQGLNNFITSKVSKHYWLNKVLSSTAKQAHIDGDIHIHDLNLLSSYTYNAQEIVIIKNNKNQILFVSMAQAYDLCTSEEHETPDYNETEIVIKYPENWYVWDKTGWTVIKRLLRKKKTKEMIFLKTKSGHTSWVTEDHPIITSIEEVTAGNIVPGTHRCFTCDIEDVLPETSNPYSYNSMYALGSIASSIYIDLYNIKSDYTVYSQSKLQLERIAEGLDELRPSSNKIVKLRVGSDEGYSYVVQDVLKLPLIKETLAIINFKDYKVIPMSILQYPKESIKYFLAGWIDNIGKVIDNDTLFINHSSKILIEQLAMLLRCFGLYPTIIPCEDTETFTFTLALRRLEDIKFPSVLYNKLSDYSEAAIFDEQNIWSPIIDKQIIPHTDKYIYDITTESSTLIVNGLWCHNCSGWDLRDILLSGFGGVAGTNASAPAKHFDTALGQIWNFLYSLQGEAAGAQALSNVDTYLAPFIRNDNLTYKEVKQSLQKFFHNMTTKTRVGFQCVPDSYQCFTTAGWKYYHELVLGEDIFVMNTKTHKYTTQPLLNVKLEKYPTEMFQFTNVRTNETFVVSNDHVVLYYDAEGHLYKKAAHEVFRLSHIGQQIYIFLPDMNAVKGTELVGYLDEYTVKLVKTAVDIIDRKIWCPTTIQGNFICRTDTGHIFLTGNCPFTNVSLDLYVPNHMKDEAIIIGGELQSTTYGEYQHEMNIFNKAFCEVMIAGDKDGRQFNFPIPNYSVAKDFDWENPDLIPLWTMTGKYGTPYFTNFMNSDLSPEDVRSMCPIHGAEQIRVKINNTWLKMSILDLYKNLAFRKDISNVFVKFAGQEIPVVKVVQITAKNFISIKTDLSPQGFVLEINHEQPYMTSKKSKEISTITGGSIVPGQYIPYSLDVLKTQKKPKDSFESADVLWVKVLDTTIIGRIDQYAYCLEVDSELKLFEMHPEGVVTHNCRLRLDNRVLRKRGGGLFGANPLTGSIGVVTINLPRLGYKTKGNETLFFEKLSDLMDLSAQLLHDKRKFIESKMDEDFYPFMKAYMKSIKERFDEYFFNHFSTIGLVGGNECVLNFMGVPITEPEGKEFMIKVLNFMRDKTAEFQEKYDRPFNLESSPAESAAYRLAKADTDKWSDIITAITDREGAVDPYYTNSTNCPVDWTDDMLAICEHQNDLQPLYTGGTVTHILAGQGMDDPNVVKELIKAACSNYALPYITFSPKYSVCDNHGYLNGDFPECPTCGGDTEVYARIVGYYSPVKRWHKGKKQEYKLRVDHDPNTLLNHDFTKVEE